MSTTFFAHLSKNNRNINSRNIEVSIALEISEEVTTKFWEEYLKLTRHYKLLKMQDKLKDKFEKFFNFYEEVESKYSFDEIMEALEMVGKINEQIISLSILERDKKIYQKEVNMLILEKDKILQEIDVARSELQSLNTVRSIVRYQLSGRY